MTNAKFRRFMMLCKDFIEAEKKITINDGFTETDDLDYLYRFITGSTNARAVIADWKERGLLK